MNKIEAAIKETEELIRYKEKEKIHLIVEIRAYESILTKLENIQRDNSIPHEETKASETFLNSK